MDAFKGRAVGQALMGWVAGVLSGVAVFGPQMTMAMRESALRGGNAAYAGATADILAAAAAVTAFTVALSLGLMMTRDGD